MTDSSGSGKKVARNAMVPIGKKALEAIDAYIKHDRAAGGPLLPARRENA